MHNKQTPAERRGSVTETVAQAARAKHARQTDFFGGQERSDFLLLPGEEGAR